MLTTLYQLFIEAPDWLYRHPQVLAFAVGFSVNGLLLATRRSR